MALEIEAGLHRDFVKGLIQKIVYRNTVPIEAAKKPTPKSVVYKGIKNETAKLYLFECLMDGLPSLSADEIKRVLEGDYDIVWEYANNYLGHFGHGKATPERIIIEDVSYETIILENLAFSQ